MKLDYKMVGYVIAGVILAGYIMNAGAKSIGFLSDARNGFDA